MSTTDTIAYELSGTSRAHEQDDAERQIRNSSSLPPVDTGKDAFSFLAACFVLEALIWGFPFAFGVFQAYYESHEPFASQGGSAIIGTTSYGIMYFTSPFVAMIVCIWPQLRRKASYFGIAIMVSGLIAASFCDSVNALIATQGVMYGFGAIFVYFPALGLITEWFVQRRGLAFGLMWAGTGLAGAVLPFVLRWLLDSYGYRTALRVSAMVLALGTLPCVHFIKRRVPVTSGSSVRSVEIAFVKHKQFWIFLAGNVLQSLGFFIPTLYLPSFALSIGLPAFAGPLALALFNLAFCFGAVLVGFLVDRFHVTVAIMVCTLGQLIAIFVCWGFTSSQPMLYMFAILFGCFGGAYPCTWAGCAKAMQRFDQNGFVDAGILVALMNAGKGIGAVISGPLSEKLLKLDQWKGHASFAYGSGYGLLLVFTGVSAAMGGIAWLGKLAKLV